MASTLAQMRLADRQDMIFGAHVLVSATVLAASWSKFSFCWDMFRCRPLKYLGCKQRLREAVNDEIGIEPSP
ncbi:MAG: hypothetical protein WBC04_09210 [Candidatus Acidiferrales bacterium]